MNIQLLNVDINGLRTLLGRSLSVSNSLDFSISSEYIKSSVSNDDQNFWKEWAMPTKGIFDAAQPFKDIKILFSNGVYFTNKFLGLFGNQKCTINIQCNEKNEAESFEIIGQTAFGTPLKANMRTTRYEMARDPMESELHEILFGDKHVITKFMVQPQVISEINKLRGLNAMADKPQSFVTFKGGDGVIKAFDSSFEFDIAEYDGAPFEAKFPKKSLSLIDREPQEISYAKSDEQGFDWFILRGQNAIVKSESIAMLMSSLATSDSAINDDIFDDDGGWGMGED